MNKHGRELKCHCCQQWFLPNPKAAFRQKYCSRPRCKRTSKAASQRKWKDKPGNWNWLIRPKNKSASGAGVPESQNIGDAFSPDFTGIKLCYGEMIGWRGNSGYPVAIDFQFAKVQTMKNLTEQRSMRANPGSAGMIQLPPN